MKEPSKRSMDAADDVLGIMERFIKKNLKLHFLDTENRPEAVKALARRLEMHFPPEDEEGGGT